MPKLEALRKALRGGEDPAAIPPEKSKGLDVGRIRKKRQGKYTISIDGTDATLNFGSWNGWSVSDLVKRPSGRDYLNFILEKFQGDDDLKEVVRYRLHAAGFEPRKP